MAGSTPDRVETLRDGRVVSIRSLGGGDAAGIKRMWCRLDSDARRRFLLLTHIPSGADPETLAGTRPGESAGVVALADGGESHRLVGLVHHVRTADSSAEILVVVEAFQVRVA